MSESTAPGIGSLRISVRLDKSLLLQRLSDPLSIMVVLPLQRRKRFSEFLAMLAVYKYHH